MHCAAGAGARAIIITSATILQAALQKMRPEGFVD
jgi:hypothetical protein